MSRQRSRGRAVAPAPSRSAERFVLPRWLRRPVRSFSRMLSGDYVAPRFGATCATALLFAATGLYGSFISGELPAYAQAVTGRTGFAIDQVRVIGHKQTSEIDILQELELDGWTSLVGFDPEIARARIARLPWVKAAAVRKIYPDQIEVRVEEREPFALWQHGSQITVIERSGAVIMPFDGGRLATLPMVVGFGAAEDGAGFVDEIARYPELAARVRAYIRVSERRWNLRLDNGVTIKLPESGEDMAIAQLLRIDRETGLLSRDILAVDLRIDDRLVVQLTPGAVERREAAIKEEIKAARKAGKAI